jgi:hypothetical protein
LALTGKNAAGLSLRLRVMAGAVGALNALWLGWEAGKVIDSVIGKLFDLRGAMLSTHIGFKLGQSELFNDFVEGLGTITGSETLKEAARGNRNRNRQEARAEDERILRENQKPTVELDESVTRKGASGANVFQASILAGQGARGQAEEVGRAFLDSNAASPAVADAERELAQQRARDPRHRRETNLAAFDIDPTQFNITADAVAEQERLRKSSPESFNVVGEARKQKKQADQPFNVVEDAKRQFKPVDGKIQIEINDKRALVKSVSVNADSGVDLETMQTGRLAPAL